MHKFFNLLICLFLYNIPQLSCQPAVPLRTTVLKEAIHTLQIRSENGRNTLSEHIPVIELNTDERITVGFDELADSPAWLSYRLVHCNADWTPSSLSETEYLNGFNNTRIETADPSFNTFVNYYHYRITVPNEQIGFRISGNYALLIHPENDPEEIIAVACFYVTENKANISGNVSVNTDIDFKREHQQLSLQITPYLSETVNPAQDIRVHITQNSRVDHEVIVRHPSRRQGKALIYEHKRELIFEAGNNFRRFETVSSLYPGIGIEQIRHIHPLYHALLLPTEVKNALPYYYDRDQNGRFVIRNSDSEEPDTEADYFMVHFTLEDETPLREGEIHLFGEFTHGLFTPRTKMNYNFERRCYEKAMLLKQGHYNYQYLFLPFQQDRAFTAPVEGNHYEAENEYLVRVYCRVPGQRYDRLIGTALL